MRRGIGGCGSERIQPAKPRQAGVGSVELSGFEGALAFEVCTPFHVNHEQPTLEHVEAAVAQAVEWLKRKREEIAGS